MNWLRPNHKIKPGKFRLAKLAATVSITLLLAGCAIQPAAKQEANLPPARHAYLPQDTLRMSEAAKFFYKFAFADSASQTPKSEDWIIDDYLPKHHFWVRFNGITADDSSVMLRETNLATAFHIGGRYFLTAAHVAGGIKDSVWTTNKPATAEGHLIMLSDLPAGNRVLVSSEDGRSYTYRVVFRDDSLDAAVLEADSAFIAPQSPVITLDSRPLRQCDRIVHFLNGIRSHEWGKDMGLLHREQIWVSRKSGSPMCWGECTTVRSNTPPFNKYLVSYGYVFDFTQEQIEMRTLHAVDMEKARYFVSNFNISTTLVVAGNSGSPLFRKEGDRYHLVSIAHGMVPGSQTYQLLGEEWHLAALCFAKPERLQEFFGRLIDASSK